MQCTPPSKCPLNSANYISPSQKLTSFVSKRYIHALSLPVLRSPLLTHSRLSHILNVADMKNTPSQSLSIHTNSPSFLYS